MKTSVNTEYNVQNINFLNYKDVSYMEAKGDKRDNSFISKIMLKRNKVGSTVKLSVVPSKSLDICLGKSCVECEFTSDFKCKCKNSTQGEGNC